MAVRLEQCVYRCSANPARFDPFLLLTLFWLGILQNMVRQMLVI